MTAKTKKREGADHNRKFDIGDLVTVDGYTRETFRIDGYSHSHIVYEGDAWDELAYELSNVFTDDWCDADEEDMTLVCRKEQAEAHIRKLVRRNKGDDRRGRKTRKQAVDALLAELSDKIALRDTFGDDEENDYTADIGRVKARLKRLSGGVRK